LDETKTDDIAKVRSNLIGLNNLVGKYLGNEFLIEKTISSRFIRVEYIVYFERQPFRFYFVFYKPENEWIIHKFGYVDNVGEWLEEKTKGEFLYGEN
jgi:hypothetical protein